MKANDIMYKVRLYVGDTDKKSISDWEIINSINDALRLTAEESARLGGSVFRMKSDITITDGSASLPTGYLQIIKAFGGSGAEMLNVHTDIPEEGEFSITGGTIYSGENTLELWYFGYPETVLSVASTIDLPDSYISPVARVSAALLKNNIDEAVATADYFMGAKLNRQEQKG